MWESCQNKGDACWPALGGSLTVFWVRVLSGTVFLLGWGAFAVLGGCAWDLLEDWMVCTWDLAILKPLCALKPGLGNGRVMYLKINEFILEVLPGSDGDWSWPHWPMCIELGPRCTPKWLEIESLFLFYLYLFFSCIWKFVWVGSIFELPNVGYASSILLFSTH